MLYSSQNIRIKTYVAENLCDGAPRPIIMPCHPRHLCDLIRLGYPLLGVYNPSRLSLSLSLSSVALNSQPYE